MFVTRLIPVAGFRLLCTDFQEVILCLAIYSVRGFFVAAAVFADDCSAYYILISGGDSMNIFGGLSIASAVVTCIGAIAEAVSDND